MTTVQFAALLLKADPFSDMIEFKVAEHGGLVLCVNAESTDVVQNRREWEDFCSALLSGAYQQGAQIEAVVAGCSMGARFAAQRR